MTPEEDSMDAQREAMQKRGNQSGGAVMHTQDRRMTSLINWVWASLGAIGILIGLGVYTKLSDMNDTLIRAVSKLEVQGSQINELRSEVSKQRDEISALRSQVYMLEGKTLRGIQEAVRGH